MSDLAIHQTLKVNFIEQQSNLNEISSELKKIPLLSPSTLAIFKELNLPSSQRLSYPLSQKVVELTNSIKNLEKARSSTAADKLDGVLFSTVLTGVVAHNEALLYVAALSGLIFTGAKLLNYFGIDTKLPNTPLISYALVPFHPIYRGFTKVSRCENLLLEQLEEFRKEVTEYAHFFKQDFSKAQKALDAKIQSCNKILNEMKKISLEKGVSAKEITAKKDQYLMAKSKLESSIEYFSKY